MYPTRCKHPLAVIPQSGVKVEVPLLFPHHRPASLLQSARHYNHWHLYIWLPPSSQLPRKTTPRAHPQPLWGRSLERQVCLPHGGAVSSTVLSESKILFSRLISFGQYAALFYCSYLVAKSLYASEIDIAPQQIKCCGTTEILKPQNEFTFS